MRVSAPASGYRAPWLRPQPATWLDLLRARAVVQPAADALIFAPDGEEVIDRRDLQTLDRRARVIAGALARVARPGARVLCLYRQRLDFVDALFGCFYAGMIAVPTYPARARRTGSDPQWLRIESIRANCQPGVVLADETSATALRALIGDDLPVLVTPAGHLPDELAEEWREPAVGGDTICLLQYTSGSTSAPRGVVLTHEHLLANSAAIFGAFGHSAETRGALWLPHEHDMGLVGAILQPIYGLGETLLMSPLHFAQDPLTWLRAISRHRATTSGGPNFAYQMCVERIRDEDLEGLDLSCWDVAFVGAEPVRPDTLDAFARRFAPAGFDRSAFLSCYGLAESTLMVSGTPKGASPRTLRVSRTALEAGLAVAAAPGDDFLEVVSSGVPVSCELRIVAPDSPVALGEGQVGEILVRGSSVAAGYWRCDGERTFDASVSFEGGGFLRTGDLGFLLDGELFVTGRLKDLIIVDGVNHYPEDIERSIDGCHPHLRRGAGVVFGVDADGTEGVVVVWELRRPCSGPERAALAGAVRAAVARTHPVKIVDVVLTPPARIPRTGSGKVQRFECRRSYLEGGL